MELKRCTLISFAALAGCNVLIDFDECFDSAECQNSLVCREGLCVREGSGLGSCPGRVYVKVLADLTGATADVGVPFHQAEIDLIREINANGGIEGCRIEAESQDYAYDPVKAKEIYDRWKTQPEWNDVVAIFGWGSGDSLQLAPEVKIDHKPFLSASYFGGLASPEPISLQVQVPELTPTFSEELFPQQMRSDGFPFNFFAGTDYSTGARIAMFHAKTLGAKRVGFFYCGAAYCTGPVPAARAHARRIGLEIGRDLRLELTETQDDYDRKIRQYFEEELAHRAANPSYDIVDWIWGGNTTKTSAYMAIALEKVRKPVGEGGLGVSVELIVNNWGFDENLYPRCPGACAERVHGIMPFLAYGDARASEMTKVKALHDKWRQIDGDQKSYRNVRYVQGYVNVLLFKIAVERVIAAGKPLTGDTIKEALETFNQVSTGGLTDRISFSPNDHRPQSTETIYKFDASGVLVNEPPDRTIYLEESWLGW